MRQRSRTAVLAILGASAFALAGCREEQVDAEAFPSLESCRQVAEAGGRISTAECDAAFAEAQALHVESAPRYDSLQVCEEQHGAGNCGNEQEATGGSGLGSIFMPLLTGYLIGSMLGGGMARSQPLYRTSDGRFTNATGSSTLSSNSGKGRMDASQFTKPPTTMGKAPMTAATVASRGGFGSSAAARPGVGG
ncbi:uncharacterized protein YgiB involved in bioifilm formation [Cereibacter ovatus]|uniref:Uncharacterized protein YgiB involved in bioifilm formation n=1 Tax=Cereibacter ovatus TaxID=439529 RepID=A0A285CUA4_9RHOB|nr:DUF1190 domain-containing protein [Cereibacter ovatus]SNX71141.1 uncharacterized protein YgiB involved in bioifilm formation [Cereibacter ovatus]